MPYMNTYFYTLKVLPYSIFGTISIAVLHIAMCFTIFSQYLVPPRTNSAPWYNILEIYIFKRLLLTSFGSSNFKRAWSLLFPKMSILLSDVILKQAVLADAVVIKLYLPHNNYTDQWHIMKTVSQHL